MSNNTNRTQRILETRAKKDAESKIDAKIALEIVEIFKSNGLNLMRINSVLEQVKRLVNIRAKL